MTVIKSRCSAWLILTTAAIALLFSAQSKDAEASTVSFYYFVTNPGCVGCIPQQVPIGDTVERYTVLWNSDNPYPPVPYGFYPPLPKASVSLDWGDGSTTDFEVDTMFGLVSFSHPFSTEGLKIFTATFTRYWYDAANPYGAPLQEIATNTNGVMVVAATPIPAALPLFATALAGVGYAGLRRRKLVRAAASAI
jgi:hypothetical protein